MQFTFFSAALLVAASSVLGQTPHFDVLTSPAQGEYIPAGSSFNITWEPESVQGTVTITLIQGAAFNLLNKGPVLVSGLNNQDGHFIWAPVPNSGFQAYGLNISLDSDPSTYQLSNGFYISAAKSSSTTQKAEQTSTITLTPGPSYSAYVKTTTSAPWTTKSNITHTSANSTWAKPTTLTSQTSTAAAVTTAALSSTPVSSSSPSSSSPVSGAVANVASGGLAMIGGLLLALAL